MSYRDYLPKIIQHNKDSMRDAAQMYCKARKAGRVAFQLRWLMLAVCYRNLIREFGEFQ